MWPWQNHVLLAQTIYTAKGKTIEIKPKEVEHINIFVCQDPNVLPQIIPKSLGFRISNCIAADQT